MRIASALIFFGLFTCLSDQTAKEAWAGAFAVREQSTEFQGMSFAGDAAAGGGLSGMFWNPAVAAYAPKGWSAEIDGTGIFGNLDIHSEAGTTKLGFPGIAADSGNMERLSMVPAGYAAYRLSPDAVLGLSINSPFGLRTDPDRNWVGLSHNRFSEITVFGATPTLAFRLMPSLSIGVGLQVDQMHVNFLRAAVSVPDAPDIKVEVDGTGVGFTAGVNWTPTPQTSVGIGYRSQIEHTLKGNVSVPGAPILFAIGNRVESDVTLPSIATLSLRQGITDKFRLLGTIEWTQWSVFPKIVLTCPDLGLPFCTNPSHLASSVPLNWEDGWMFSLGGEFDATRQLKLRGGIGYELSPIQVPTNRTTLLPDQNRLSLSGGASYALNDGVTVDLAYSHFWGLGGKTDRTDPVIPLPPAPPVPVPERVLGTVDESADIVSAALKIRLGGP